MGGWTPLSTAKLSWSVKTRSMLDNELSIYGLTYALLLLMNQCQYLHVMLCHLATKNLINQPRFSKIESTTCLNFYIKWSLDFLIDLFTFSRSYLSIFGLFHNFSEKQVVVHGISISIFFKNVLVLSNYHSGASKKFFSRWF